VNLEGMFVNTPAAVLAEAQEILGDIGIPKWIQLFDEWKDRLAGESMQKTNLCNTTHLMLTFYSRQNNFIGWRTSHLDIAKLIVQPNDQQAFDQIIDDIAGDDRRCIEGQNIGDQQLLPRQKMEKANSDLAKWRPGAARLAKSDENCTTR
jgi:hypothetical protein